MAPNPPQTSVLAVPEAGYEVRFIESTADTKGERLVTEWTVPNYPGPLEHFHPAMTESWTVLEGSLSISVAGEASILSAGETATVAPGIRHSFTAPGPVRWRQTNEPALQHEVLFHLDADVVRRHGSAGKPGPIQTIRLLAASDAVFVGPPLMLQRVLHPIGNLLNLWLRRRLLTQR